MKRQQIYPRPRADLRGLPDHRCRPHGGPRRGRAGAGADDVAVPEIALPIYAAALTSMMVGPLAAPEDFDRLLADRRFSAFLIGPGAGTGDETRTRALAMLATGRPTLLDADALTAFHDNPTRSIRR